MMTLEERMRELFSGQCTCGGVDIGVGLMHEPRCGYPTPDDVATHLVAVRAEGRREGMEEERDWWAAAMSTTAKLYRLNGKKESHFVGYARCLEELLTEYLRARGGTIRAAIEKEKP